MVKETVLVLEGNRTDGPVETWTVEGKGTRTLKNQQSGGSSGNSLFTSRRGLR